MPRSTDFLEHKQLIRRWSKCWRVPKLSHEISLEWSKRLRCSLGRAYPERRLIRLSELLKNPEYEHLLNEVLCHEAAHIAAYEIYGKQAKCHGLEWQELVRLAGFEPESCYKVDSIRRPRDEDRVLYEHVCTVCHASRLARRRQPQWRCVACQNAGLDGALVIRSVPKNLESLDA